MRLIDELIKIFNRLVDGEIVAELMLASIRSVSPAQMNIGSSVETVESARRFQEELRRSGRERGREGAGERDREGGGGRRFNEKVQVPQVFFPSSFVFRAKAQRNTMWLLLFCITECSK